MSGKGDQLRFRQVDWEDWDNNWESTFGSKSNEELSESYESNTGPLAPNPIKVFTRTDEFLGQRTVTIQEDDPGFDCTDGAHPAWWRGHDYTFEKMVGELNKTLNHSSLHQLSWQEILKRIEYLKACAKQAADRGVLGV